VSDRTVRVAGVLALPRATAIRILEAVMTLAFIHPGRFAYLLLSLVVMLVPVGQQSFAQDAPAGAAAGAGIFSQQDLDEILAPIALYPDALLAQIFMASTYPMEVVEAARWQKSNPDLSGQALEDALQEKDWDPAVKSVTAVPQVLTMMDEKLDWTQKLGDAFLAQQEDVMNTVQNLRQKAKQAGNLESTEQQAVKTETEAGQTIVIVESTKPEVVYVPTYNPAIIYGTWWYPYPPPYYYYPPGYVAGVGLWFTTGVIVGSAIWGHCHWRRNEINIDINRYNSFNRTNIKTGDWRHDPKHRKGVAYRDNATAQRFNRGGDKAATQAREQFRGRAEQGRADLKDMDRGKLDGQIRTADRAAPKAERDRRAGGEAGPRPGTAAGGDRGSRDDSLRAGASADRGARDRGVGSGANRDLGAGNRGGRDAVGSGSRGGGFAGVGSGASTRAASTRGSRSFGARGGGMRGGGRR